MPAGRRHVSIAGTRSGGDAMKKNNQAVRAGALLLAGALALPAWAQGSFPALGKGRVPQHLRCKAVKLCVVTVVVERSTAGGNTCGIDVVDVVYLHRRTETLVFSLKAGGVGPSGATYSFRAGGQGIVIGENHDDTTSFDEPQASAPAASGATVFQFDAAQSTPTLERRNLQSWVDKVFTYAIQLDRTPAAGGPSAPCPPLDPVIVSRGD